MSFRHTSGLLAWLLTAPVIGCGGSNGETPPLAATPAGGTAPPIVVPSTTLPPVLMQRRPSQVGIGTTVRFSSNAVGLASLTHRWEFGDGSTSTEAGPSRHFDTQGERSVRLTVQDAHGGSRTEVWPLWVGRFADLDGVRCSGPGRSGWCRQTIDERRSLFFVDAWRGFAVGAGRPVHRGVVYVTATGGR